MTFEIYQEAKASGDEQMLRDRQLLEAAVHGKQEAVIRFYAWNMPTVSLGFHQKESVLQLEKMAADGVPWVRRPTGGAAVLHSDELTYAVICPKVENPQFSSLVLEYAGRALTEGLRALGVDANLEARGEPLSALPNRTMCFARTSRWKSLQTVERLLGAHRENWRAQSYNMDRFYWATTIYGSRSS